jgi:GT2 family glycosyltransferase
MGNYLLSFPKTPFLQNMSKTKKKASIIILTYNALEYVKKCFKSLEKTDYPNYEIIVVDNNSKPPVKKYLKYLKKKGQINKLYLSPKNTYWAGGNNIGVSLSAEDSDYVLLLNSDVEIKNKDWLNVLVGLAPKNGAISFGVCLGRRVCDGWCLLICKKTFDKAGRLNEDYPFWGSDCELLYNILKKGFSILAISNPESYIIHYRKKSIDYEDPDFKKHTNLFFSINKNKFDFANMNSQVIWIVGKNVFTNYRFGLWLEKKIQQLKFLK